MALDYDFSDAANDSTNQSRPDRPRPVGLAHPLMVPHALKSLDRWGNFTFEWKDAKEADKRKWTKRPYNGRHHTASTNLDQWGRFNDALTMYMRFNAANDYAPRATNPRVDGLGFAFFAEDAIRGIDVDHCIDRETGEINVVGQKALELFGGKTYIERSPSGDGLHIFLRSTVDVPAGRNVNKAMNTELYASGRFFTFTANPMPQAADDVNELGELDAEFAEWMAYTQPEGVARVAKNLDVSVLDNGLVIDPSVTISDDLKHRLKTCNPRVWATFVGERNHVFCDSTGSVNRNQVDMSLVSLMAAAVDEDYQPIFSQQDIVNAAIHARRESGAKVKSSPKYYWERTLTQVFAPDADDNDASDTSIESNEADEADTPERNAIVPMNTPPAVAEAEAIIAAAATKSGDAAPETQKTKLPMIDASDAGNADRFVRIFRNTKRYAKENKAWMVLDPDEKLWAEDNDSAAYSIRTVAEDIERDAKRLSDLAENAETTDAQKNLDRLAGKGFAWATTSKSGSHPETMLKQARSPLMISSEVFDQNQMLFATHDGVINLVTGELRKRTAEDYLTKRTKVKYNPNATAPVWQKFINRIFGNDAEMIDYVQRWFGYCLTGSVREEKMAIFFGDGQNGKSKLIEAVGNAMGMYARPIETGLLTLRGYTGGNTPDKVELKGTRLAVATEPNDTARLDEAQIKALTGGDMITATAKYKNPITFAPTHKFMLMTNHKPIVNGTDKGIWRRLVLIPMPVTIPDAEVDRELGEKLKAEAEGILLWLIEGCIKWQQRNLSRDVPQIVVETTEVWREQEDTIGRFIEDAFDIDPEYMEGASDVLHAYRVFMSRTTLGDVPMNSRRFKEELPKRGFQWKHTNVGACYMGLHLKASYKGYSV